MKKVDNVRQIARDRWTDPTERVVNGPRSLIARFNCDVHIIQLVKGGL